jgi:hypothetical protein
MTKIRKKRGRFKLGDWVRFPYGAADVFAQVIEERGPIGVKGRHLYRIQIDRDAEEPDAFELAEDDLQAASPPDKSAIVKYLKEGGLVSILRCNLGGSAQPRVWLTYTPRGGITHTLVAERGMMGGAAVPFFALHEYKVFTGKQNQVAEFLASFGLNRDEAQEVIAAIGTAP